jgi:predicted DCC family thiol-disulfide oxidoreductase YuxK
MPPPILLYDGVCGLCNRLVQFVLRHDRNSLFRFVSLQSALAARILARHGADPHDLDTVYVAIDYDPARADPGERLLVRSEAVIFVLEQLRGIWTLLGFLMRIVPRPLRDWKYRLVARYRYRVFGRYETCPLPRREDCDRFLDL